MNNCPACKSNNISDSAPVSDNCFVMCFDCKMSGPGKNTQAEAEAAWDALPRDNAAPDLLEACKTLANVISGWDGEWQRQCGSDFVDAYAMLIAAISKAEPQP
jgi:hypothetical protein